MKLQVIYEAISEPNRREILELLKKREMSVSDIASHFNISGASLSHHLNKLKSADLVISRRKGQNILYSIHTSVFEDAAKMAADFFRLGGQKHATRFKKKLG